MKNVNIGIIGCGTVGVNVVKILEKHSVIIKNRVGCGINIKWVCDKDLSKLKQLNLPSEKVTTDVNKVILDPSVDILVELIGGSDISKKIIVEAMNRGKHIVTANKAVLSKYWDEIFSIALRKKVLVYFEAAVGAGIPVIQSLNEGLAANKIQSIVGILNGTTNFILSKMTDDQMGFDEALKLAQKSGFAEANPLLDLDGSDAAQKLSILASITFGNHLPIDAIHREGISDISPIDIRYAKNEFRYVLKLLASVKNENGKISATVCPTLIDVEHPLAAVENEYNAIYIEGDSCGDIMLYGKGAGGPAAASAVASDIIYLATNIFYGTAGKFPFILYDKKIKLNIRPVEDIVSKYYLRFSTADKPGVLSKISGILGKNNVSISACFQEERHKKQAVPVLMLTHQTKEGNIRKALKIIDDLPIVKSKTVMFRIME
ncbi:MAG: homoserine dehydrogenase [Elusimicrobia bacterium]|nr:homoserine dehydrogenase [Elusimicrobiota bacterium]